MADKDLKDLLLVDEPESVGETQEFSSIEEFEKAQETQEFSSIEEFEKAQGTQEFSSIEDFEKAQGTQEFSSIEEFEKAQGAAKGVGRLEGRESRPKRQPNPKNTVVLSAPTQHGEARGSLSRKLLLGALLTALIPLIIAISVLGLISQRSSEEAIVEATQQQLISVRDAKKAQIEDAFDLFGSQIVNLAASIETVEFVEHITGAFRDFTLEANSGSPFKFRGVSSAQRSSYRLLQW